MRHRPVGNAAKQFADQFVGKATEPKPDTPEEEAEVQRQERRRALDPLGVTEGDAIDRKVMLLQEHAANRSYFRAKRNIAADLKSADG